MSAELSPLHIVQKTKENKNDKNPSILILIKVDTSIYETMNTEVFNFSYNCDLE